MTASREAHHTLRHEHALHNPGIKYVISGIATALCFSASLYVQANPTGISLLTWGWLAPLAGSLAPGHVSLISCFAWYANIPLAILILQLLAGIKPHFYLAAAALLLALTGLGHLPNSAPFNSVEYIRGPQITLWLAAFAITAAASCSFRRRDNTAISSSETNAKETALRAATAGLIIIGSLLLTANLFGMGLLRLGNLMHD